MNCARLYLVAFWYKDCHYANPSKVYHWGADDTIHGVGVVWSHWKGFNYSLKTISMDLSTFMATDVRATGLKSLRQVIFEDFGTGVRAFTFVPFNLCVHIHTC